MRVASSTIPRVESLHAYVPADRLVSLARGIDLPDRSTGAALFADVSGFTPLTEALLRSLGPQRGAEELPKWLNRIYDALIAEVDAYRGSVLSFSGDAITCWFDDRDIAGAAAKSDMGRTDQRPRPLAAAVLRATCCAVAMQSAMKQFEQVDIPGARSVNLAIKVTIATGPIRRFLVGDPEILLIDALAGDTLNRLAAAEHQAQRGEVLLDEPSVAALGNQLSIEEWREDQEHGWRFARTTELLAAVRRAAWPAMGPGILSDAQLRPWLLPPVYERLTNGMGEFLTELRSTVPLFLHFGGIDFDTDPQAASKLDMFVRAVQRIITRYGGYMLQVVIGDKGCYLYASFGAPLAYEDNAIRAVSAALELRELQMSFITGIQIGISQGPARTGAYGGLTRRTYGALGDDVNLAARLMQNAPVGEALVTREARKATTDSFVWEERPPLAVKGKSEAVTVFRLLARQERLTIHLHEPRYALAMVGRKAELALIEQKLDLAIQGHGQIVGITAEAGMGKSRLTAEVVRLARSRGVLTYGGECQSYGTNTSYLVWQNIWRSFFGIDPSQPIADQITILEERLAQVDPALLPRLPLLGAMLGLPVTDTELTASFDAKLRKESLESLLLDCMKQRTHGSAILLVLEDAHWIDPLSDDLLEVIGRLAADLPVMIVLAYRPPQVERLLGTRVGNLFHFTQVALSDLPAEEIEQMVALKLGQTYGESFAITPELLRQIAARSEGNPFYIEELLNYLRDRGIDPQEPDALTKSDLPSSLHSLILSRIDQLTENQKTLVKVASVIGRVFQAAMVWGVHNQSGSQERLRHELEVLSSLDLTSLDTPEPELTYLFKHILTREVAYDTISFATRALLHDQIGQYIEEKYSDELDQYVDLLAYHYDRSENLDKKREYLLKAGEAAQSAYANAAAVSYFERALPLQPVAKQPAVMLRLGQVLELIGEWQRSEGLYRSVQELAQSQGNTALSAQAEHALGWLLRKRGQYGEAEKSLDSARQSYGQISDMAGVSRTFADLGEIQRLQGRYLEAQRYYDESLRLAARISAPAGLKVARAHALKGAGTVLTWQGDYAAGRALNEESLALRRELGDTPGVATLLNNLGIIARFQHDLAGARRMNEESLALFRKIGDRWSVGQLLNNQACIASDQGQYAEARSLLQESLSIRRQLGDRAGLALSLNTLADVVLDEGDFEAARPLLDESLSIDRELGDQTAIAYLMEDYSGLAAAEGKHSRALTLAGFASALRENIGAPLPPSEQARLDRMIAPARAFLAPAEAEIAWNAGCSLMLDQAVELAFSLG